MRSLSLRDHYALFRARLAKSDTLYPVFVRIWSLYRPRQKELLSGPRTEIVIEGFPRSANTYAHAFFLLAQDHEVVTAHHLHESYQIRYAEKHDIPCVVLLREPLDAIVSALLREQGYTAYSQLMSYIWLYENILKHHKKAVIAPFETVTRDFNAVIEAVNRQYDQSFITLPAERLDEVREDVSRRDRRALGGDTPDPIRLAAPSEEKRIPAEALRDEIESDYGPLLARARQIYESIMQIMDQSLVTAGPSATST